MTDTLAVDKLPVAMRLRQMVNDLIIADMLNAKSGLPNGGWADPFDAETGVDNPLPSIDSNTVLAMNFADGNGATTFADSSTFSNTFTGSGGVSVTTSSPMAGTPG